MLFVNFFILFQVYYLISANLKQVDYLNSKLNFLFDNATDPIILLDQNTQIIEASPSAQDLFDCTMNDILNRQFLDFIDVEHRDFFFNSHLHNINFSISLKLISKKNIQKEVTVICKNLSDTKIYYIEDKTSEIVDLKLHKFQQRIDRIFINQIQLNQCLSEVANLINDNFQAPYTVIEIMDRTNFQCCYCGYYGITEYQYFEFKNKSEILKEKIYKKDSIEFWTNEENSQQEPMNICISIPLHINEQFKGMISIGYIKNSESLKFHYEIVKNYVKHLNIILNQKITEIILKEYKQKIDSILSSTVEGYWILDKKCKILEVNFVLCKLLGFRKDELIGKDVTNFVSEESKNTFKSQLLLIPHTKHRRYQLVLLSKTKNKIYVLISAFTIFSSEGAPISSHAFVTDITEIKKSEQKISRLNRIYTVLYKTNEAIVRNSNEGQLSKFICKAIVEQGGLKMCWFGKVDYDRNEVIPSQWAGCDDGYLNNFIIKLDDPVLSKGPSGRAVLEKKPIFFNNLSQNEDFKPWMQRAIDRGFHSSASFPIVIDHKTQYLLNLYSTEVDFFNQEELELFEKLTTDIAFGINYYKLNQEKQLIDEKLKYNALYDDLSKLYNRVYFMEQLEHIKLQIKTDSDFRIAILFIDLDRFKTVNDSLGHFSGDELLVQVSCRFKKVIQNNYILSRIGGDEFGLLITNYVDIKEVQIVSQQILDSLKEPFNIEDTEFLMTASIGIATNSVEITDPMLVLRNADIAMYKAKELGRDNYQFYEKDMETMELDRLMLANSIKKALEKEEFLLHYQPKIVLKTGYVSGFEALIRWQHPILGMVHPGKFIQVAEENGLIIPIGEWIIKKVCQDIRAWMDEGYLDFQVAINLSAKNFRYKNIVEYISKNLIENQLPPNVLEIELTESHIMNNPDQANEILKELKQIGVLISIDDFGTGYSSLNYLKKFPIDKLKIDQSFIRDIVQDQNDSAITLAIIAMSKAMNLKVIAEGVENEMQYEFLKNTDCDEMQGYLISPPIPKDRAVHFLKDRYKRLP